MSPAHSARTMSSQRSISSASQKRCSVAASPTREAQRILKPLKSESESILRVRRNCRMREGGLEALEVSNCDDPNGRSQETLRDAGALTRVGESGASMLSQFLGP